MSIFYLNELKKIWPVFVPLLVSAQQGRNVTCTHYTPFNITCFIYAGSLLLLYLHSYMH